MKELSPNVPDFGWVEEVHHHGGLTVTISCRAIVPGLGISDLVNTYVEAAKTGRPWSLNPDDWAETKGVEAVAAAILNAIYSDKSPG